MCEILQGFFVFVFHPLAKYLKSCENLTFIDGFLLFYASICTILCNFDCACSHVCNAQYHETDPCLKWPWSANFCLFFRNLSWQALARFQWWYCCSNYLKIFGGVMHGTMKLMVIKLPLYVASLDHCDLTHCPLVTACDVIEQVQHDSVNGLFCDFEQQVITWNNFDLISCVAFIWSTKHIYTFQNYSKLQSQHAGTMPLTKVVSRLSPMSFTFPLFGGRALQVPKHLTRFHCPFGNMLTR